MWILYRQLGISFLSPAAIAVISTACVMALSAPVGGAQRRWNEGIQTRVDITTDVLNSMKVSSCLQSMPSIVFDNTLQAVKMLGFTPKVARILQELRINELKLSSLFRRLLCATAFFSNNMRVLAPFVTFVVFVLIQNYSKLELTSASAFTTLSLIGMLANPVGTLLRTIPMLTSALACFYRIQTFLELPSLKSSALPPWRESRSHNDKKSSQDSVSQHMRSDMLECTAIKLREVDEQGQLCPEPSILAVRHASFSWAIDGPSVIDKISFSVLRNSFFFIIGPVGCGKSTLLKGLLNETHVQGFAYNSSTGIAFVDQTPWIQNATIRQNVTGSSNIDVPWYEEVIRACALDYDIAALPDSHGMLTCIGSSIEPLRC
jgi:ABC-type multidrug transport system fused ATPase/permease subunit